MRTQVCSLRTSYLPTAPKAVRHENRVLVNLLEIGRGLRITTGDAEGPTRRTISIITLCESFIFIIFFKNRILTDIFYILFTQKTFCFRTLFMLGLYRQTIICESCLRDYSASARSDTKAFQLLLSPRSRSEENTFK